MDTSGIRRRCALSSFYFMDLRAETKRPLKMRTATVPYGHRGGFGYLRCELFQLSTQSKLTVQAREPAIGSRSEIMRRR